MKYGIFGDIHANLTALRAVHAELIKRGAEKFLSVGDIVGYGPRPSETIAFVREINAEVVKGNHDAAVMSDKILHDFSRHAFEGIMFTRTALSAEEKRWLSTRPHEIVTEHIHLCHGELVRPESFNYVLDDFSRELCMDAGKAQMCVIGHTHLPEICTMRAIIPEDVWADRIVHFDIKELYSKGEFKCDVSALFRVLVNVGSVGQPRDKDARAVGTVIDTEAETISMFRVAYDVEAEIALSLAKGLNNQRLRAGV